MIKGLLRFVIAVIFILSGFVKAVDLVGFSFKMEEYFCAAVFSDRSDFRTSSRVYALIKIKA
jgi:hypothetical protein